MEEDVEEDIGEEFGAKRSNSNDEIGHAIPNFNHESEFPSPRDDDGDDENDNFLLSESKRKLLRMGKQSEDVDYRSFVFPCALVSLLLLLFASIRGRNKVSAKMN